MSKQPSGHPLKLNFSGRRASISLYSVNMKSKSALCTALAAVALFIVLVFPRSSSGQAGATDDPLVNAVLIEITAQQTVLAENQAKIDEKVAAIAEDVRVSRIFAGRAGGKAK